MSEDNKESSGLPGPRAGVQRAKADHTPGPWVYIPPRPYDGDDEDLLGSFYTPGGIEGADGNPVCIFGDYSGSATMFENPANPHLIAGAPDYAAGVERMLAHESSGGDGWWSGWEMLKAAHAKATGADQ